MRTIITKNNSEIKENQSVLIEEGLKKMYSLFDMDKNGILDFVEIASALSILCKGTVVDKIKAVFSNFFAQTPSATEKSIAYVDLKKYFACVFKLAMETTKEVSEYHYL